MVNRQYLKVGQSAKNSLFGITPSRKSRSGSSAGTRDGYTALQMLISQQGKLKHGRLAVIVFGLFTLIIGIIMSCVPWVDYLVLKNLKLRNGSLSYHYWQRPGVVRLTRVYIFNVTNADNFLNYGEKPKLVEVGPFVYREDMEKVNIKFHDNGTVSFQHNKILQFVPELSKDVNKKLIVPNIPLLTLSSQLTSLPWLAQRLISPFLTVGKMKEFVEITPHQLLFGYEDLLVAAAHTFYPKDRRPMAKMGLLLGRNGTVHDVSTIYTGTGPDGMDNFGLMERLNGLDHLPYWKESPCNRLMASEGSFFPPRERTGSDRVYVWDKDMCRVLPLDYRSTSTKNGIPYDLFTPPEDVFQPDMPDNECFCPGMQWCPPKGLQNISPCQFNAPVYLSFPHFYKSDPSLLEAVEGLQPVQEKHETYFKLQSKLGVPLEGLVRVQLNLKVDQANAIKSTRRFPTIVYPIMWVEEGVDDLPAPIKRWIYLATTFSDNVTPVLTWGAALGGALTLVCVFVRAHKDLVFSQRSIEMGMRTLRRGSSMLINGQHHHRLIINRDSYALLPEQQDQEDV